jgi:hypothetical protein
VFLHNKYSPFPASTSGLVSIKQRRGRGLSPDYGELSIERWKDGLTNHPGPKVTTSKCREEQILRDETWRIRACHVSPLPYIETCACRQCTVCRHGRHTISGESFFAPRVLTPPVSSRIIVAVQSRFPGTHSWPPTGWNGNRVLSLYLHCYVVNFFIFDYLFYLK